MLDQSSMAEIIRNQEDRINQLLNQLELERKNSNEKIEVKEIVPIKSLVNKEVQVSVK